MAADVKCCFCEGAFTKVGKNNLGRYSPYVFANPYTLKKVFYPNWVDGADPQRQESITLGLRLGRKAGGRNVIHDHDYAELVTSSTPSTNGAASLPTSVALPCNANGGGLWVTPSTSVSTPTTSSSSRQAAPPGAPASLLRPDFVHPNNSDHEQLTTCFEPGELGTFDIQDAMSTASSTPVSRPFMCDTCLSYLRRNTVPMYRNGCTGNRTSVKRKLMSGSEKQDKQSKKVRPALLQCLAATTLPKKQNIPVTSNKKSFVQSACQELLKYRYSKAFRILSQNKSARAALRMYAIQLIRKEKRKLRANKSLKLHREVTLETLSHFNWSDIMEEVQKEAPMLTACHEAMFPKAEKILGQKVLGPMNNRRTLAIEEASQLLDMRRGVSLSVALFTGWPRAFGYLQIALGIELWRQGATVKTYDALNKLGLSYSSWGVRSHIRRLTSAHDKHMCEWKQDVEAYRHVVRQSSKRSFISMAKGFGFGVWWDGLQKRAMAQQQEAEEESLLWAMTFGARHRVPTLQYRSDNHTNASDIPVSAFLATTADYVRLRSHMENIVGKILLKNIDALRDFPVLQHFTHEFTEDMNQKSSIVNLGVLGTNPSSTSGCMKVMEHLHKYVPESDSQLVPILCNGDGPSVKRMVQVHKARSNADSPSQRLDGLVETPQEFHKETVLLEDTLDLLYRRSLAGKGTLAEMEAFFNHKTLTRCTAENLWDMLQFYTSAYVVLCAMRLRNMESTGDIGESLPTKTSERQWLMRLAAEVVDFCWSAPPASDNAAVIEGMKPTSPRLYATFRPCCMEEKDDECVRCFSLYCNHGSIHRSCAVASGRPVLDDDEDWYCSPACEKDGSYIFCSCHKRKEDTMVECSRQEKCKQRRWYHLSCVQDLDIANDEWYCTEECALGALDDDPVLNHSKALMWIGLNNIVRRDAVREGNGPEILSHWKMDLPQFWTNNHLDDFVVAHRFLANVGGFVSTRVRQDLIWNRLANLTGQPGRNVAIDRVNDLRNRNLKEKLKHSRGQQTLQRVNYWAEIGTANGKQIARLFSEQQNVDDFEESEPDWYRNDIRTFCATYQQHALMDYIPGRQLAGFEEFQFDQQMRDPQKMGEKIDELNHEMDDQFRLEGRHLPP